MVSTEAKSCPHCGSPDPTPEARWPEWCGRRRDELEAELLHWFADRESDEGFDRLVECLHRRFPDSEVAVEALEKGEQFVAKVCLASDPRFDAPFFRAEDFGYSFGDLEYVGLTKLELDELCPSATRLPNVGSGSVMYCRTKNLPTTRRYLELHQLLVGDDQTHLAIDREKAQSLKGPGIPHPGVSELNGWDYCVWSTEDFLVLEGLYLHGVPVEGMPWVLHLGDVKSVEVELTHDVQTDVQTLDLPYFNTVPRSPEYAKSALVGGLLGGPVGAIVGAAHASDAAHRGRTTLGTKTFEFERQRTYTEATVTIGTELVPHMQIHLHDEVYAAAALDGRICERFLRLLQERIVHGRTVRLVQLAWAEKRGSLEGWTLDSDEILDAAGAIDPASRVWIEKQDERRAVFSRIAELKDEIHRNSARRMELSEQSQRNVADNLSDSWLSSAFPLPMGRAHARRKQFDAIDKQITLERERLSLQSDSLLDELRHCRETLAG